MDLFIRYPTTGIGLLIFLVVAQWTLFAWLIRAIVGGLRDMAMTLNNHLSTIAANQAVTAEILRQMNDKMLTALIQQTEVAHVVARKIGEGSEGVRGSGEGERSTSAAASPGSKPDGQTPRTA